ncbi:MAG: endonuclease/exonuclease/phosphatase family protein [Planctomycetota bacterium]
MKHSLAMLFMCAVVSAGCTQPRPIAVDGFTDDWAPGATVAADSDYLYFKVSFTQMRSLWRGDESVVIAIDLDADDTTGDIGAIEPGADLVVQTNVAVEGDRRARAVVTGYAAAGDPVVIEQSVSRLHAQPTYASDVYELRIRRNPDFAGHVPTDALLGSGTVEVAIARFDAVTGEPVARTTRAELELPPFDPQTRLSDRPIPPKPTDGVRVLAYNVLWSGPTKAEPGPEPFARLLQSADPDVVFLQEWYDRELDRGKTPAQLAAQVEAWFDTHVGDGPWRAVGSVARGVFVVSRYDLLDAGPEELSAEPNSRWDFPVRLASAVFDSPHGPLVVGSVHLKCCGSLGTEEDVRRLDEARVINDTLETMAATGTGFLPVILGGDYNHNGHPRVVRTMVEDLDTDATELLTLNARVFGTDDVYTYGTPDRGYRRSRLDYFSVPDSVFEVAQSFVIDTTRMSVAALDASELEADDIEGSDHLPVVADLVPIERRD